MNKKTDPQSIYKMDDDSRRNFIKNLGFFLGAFSVSSVVRFETMEKVSKKIFGSATAFAQGSADNCLNVIINLRGGAPFRELISLSTDDQADGNHADINIQHALGDMVPFTVGAGAKLVMPNTSANILQDYQQTIQFCNTFRSTGHTDALDIAALAGGGTGNPLIWAAQQHGTSTTDNSFAFYDGPSTAEMGSLPPGKSAYHPSFYRSIDDLTSKFSKLTLNTAIDNTFTDAERDGLFGLIQQKFTQDVDRAIKTTANKDVTVGSNSKAMESLKVDYSQLLDPNVANPIIDSLRSNLPTRPSRVRGVIPVDAFYAFAQAAQAGITNNTTLFGLNARDWHKDNSRRGEDTNADQITTMEYMAQTIRNILDQGGVFDNPQTGQKFQIRIVCTSEFFRGNRFRGTDNPDGGKNGAVLFGSDASAFQGFNPGSFGGMVVDEEGLNPKDLYAVDASGTLVEKNNGNWSRESLLRHVSRFMKLDLQAAGAPSATDDEEVKQVLGG